MVLVWTITAEKAPVGANSGDVTGDEDSGFSSDDDTHDVPVGTNIDDNDSFFFHG